MNTGATTESGLPAPTNGSLQLHLLVVATCALFTLIGISLIPYAGVQNDEALFANAIYQPANREFCIRMFHHYIPLMSTDHIGTLKSLLYWPIFTIFRPSAFSVRLPMVFAGALTIWIFFRLALSVEGRGRAAIFAALLLSSDTSFLLTDTFDWGPVALEHLLLVSACLFLVRFSDRHKELDLAAALLLLGLALWNRADFVWALARLAVAGGVVFWPEISRSVNRRTAGVAVISFFIGALPILAYNMHRPNATLRANARLEFSKFGAKFLQVRLTADGSDLFGYVVEDSADHPKIASQLAGRVAQWIRNHLGEHRHNGMFWALMTAALSVPLWWHSKAARFSLVFMTVTWLSMAATRDAGGSSHHVMMLWPFPQLFLALVLASLRWSWAATTAVVALFVLNLLVINQYLLQLERYGAAVDFTDGLFPLSEGIEDSPGQIIYVTDWGMFNTLVLFHRGQLNIHQVSDMFIKAALSQADEERLARMFSDPLAFFIGRAPGREALPGVQQRVNVTAAARGYRKDPIRVIPDSNGRPVFELFRFLPAI